MRDPLGVLKKEIDWEAFRADLSQRHEKHRKSAAGAKPWDVVVMFKVLILQQTYNLSDEQIEYPIRDRLSFMRFLGLRLEDKVPDAKTVWLYREHLAEHPLTEKLFTRFHEPLAQKDGGARWAKKGDEAHFGYKNHVNVDDEHKRVQSYAVTDAAVHDSQVFDELLDHTVDDKGDKRPVYADSAYRSKLSRRKFVCRQKKYLVDEIKTGKRIFRGGRYTGTAAARSPCGCPMPRSARSCRSDGAPRGQSFPSRLPVAEF